MYNEHSFQLDSRLEQDSLFVARLPLSELRLFNCRELLWLILVPQVPYITEFYQLSLPEQTLLLQELKELSQILATHFPCDKLNLASLGNLVPQLHFHVLARRVNDPYWPNPAFGAPRTPYQEDEAKQLITELRAYL